MSVPDMCESTIVLCDRIKERVFSITEEHNAQLRHAECGEFEAARLAQRMHAELEESELEFRLAQQAHANMGWEDYVQALQASKAAWDFAHKESEVCSEEIKFAQRLQSEYHEECEAHAHHQRHHHIPVVMNEPQVQGLPIELPQDVAAKGIPVCRECEHLQRQLLWSEIETQYADFTANMVMDEQLSGQSDSSAHTGGHESNLDFYHDALVRNGLRDPDPLMIPNGPEDF